MSILDLFTSGAQKRAKTYFAGLVNIAFTDEAMSVDELNFLRKMAQDLNISDADFTKILEKPDDFPIDSPLDYNDRIEQLFNFTNMIFADNEIKVDEVKIVRKLAVGLGFLVKNVEKVADEAIHLVMNKNDLNAFTQAIKAVNIQDLFD